MFSRIISVDRGALVLKKELERKEREREKVQGDTHGDQKRAPFPLKPP